jgi:large subunit ribosomal protein L4e
MNIQVTDGTVQKAVKLPSQFDEPFRPDLIKRAVVSLESRQRQSYGTHPLAGMRHAVKLSRRRRDYKGAYGKGISRIPRKTHSRNGENMYWVGAFAPGTVGGRRAHPPKVGRIYAKAINIKERRKAIRSAMAATMKKELVLKRGHLLPQSFPLALDVSVEQISTAKKLLEFMHKVGLQNELEKAQSRKGPLIVVSQKCGLAKAASNIPGIDVVTVRQLNAKLLAPGGLAGRLTLFTQPALETLSKEGLFA